MTLKFETTCRLCMSQTDTSQPLFTKNDTLVSRIMDLVPVLKLSPDDGLPAQVCEQCVLQVNSSYNFKQQCEISDVSLRQYLSQSESQNELCWESSSTLTNMKIEPGGSDADPGGSDADPLFITSEKNYVDIKMEIPEEPAVFLANENVLEDHANADIEPKVVSQLMVSCDEDIPEKGKQRPQRKKLSVQTKTPDISAYEHTLKMKEEQCQNTLLTNESLVNDNQTNMLELLPVQDLFQCKICEKRFTTKSKLKDHMGRHVGGRPHKCELCGKGFNERSSLKKHSIFHTGQKSHVCDVCGKRFTLLSGLKTHARIHTGQKSHICDVCGKEFSQQGGFKMHSLLHTGEKPFTCNLCGRGFAQKNTLKIHLSSHTELRPYVCDICGKSFKQQAYLRKHKFGHSGVKQFSCHIYGCSFTVKRNLKKHVVKIHGAVLSNQ